MAQGLEMGKAKCTGAGKGGLRQSGLHVRSWSWGALFTGSGDSGKVSEERKECQARCVCGKTGMREEGEVPSRGCSVGPGKARREMNRVGAERMERWD